MKTKKTSARLLSILLALCMMLSLLPTMTFAVEPGITITTLENVTGGPGWNYNEDSNNLFLHNYNGGPIKCTGLGKLTLYLSGTNTITVAGETAIGIAVSGRADKYNELTIRNYDGSGSLTINATSSSNYACGISCEYLYMESDNVYINATGRKKLTVFPPCGHIMVLSVAMRRQLSCPVCGQHLVDADDNTKSQVRPVQKNSKWIPDYYQKCPRCKNDIGIKTVKPVELQSQRQ